MGDAAGAGDTAEAWGHCPGAPLLPGDRAGAKGSTHGAAPTGQPGRPRSPPARPLPGRGSRGVPGGRGRDMR